MTQFKRIAEPDPTNLGGLASRDTSYSGLDPLLMEPFAVIDSAPQQPRPNDIFPLAGALQRTWHDVCKDLRAISWARGGLWFSFVCWAVGLLVASIMIPIFASGLIEASACQPDGSFKVVSRYNQWNINGFFQITAGVGHLSFTEAKIIDVCWDVVVGRLGQTILVLFSWKAFSVHLTASMRGPKPRPVTYDTYWAFFMSTEVNLVALGKVVRDFASGRSLKSVPTRILMVLTMIFVLAWPTIAGAMTGYNSNNVAFVETADGSLARFSSFQPILYVIHDGSRVGLSDGYLVPYCNRESSDGDPVAFSETYTDYGFCEDYRKTQSPLQGNASEYARSYGFYGLSNSSSIWGFPNTTLSAPVLNISAFYIDGSLSRIYGKDWVDPRTGTTWFSDWSNMTYAYNNVTYSVQSLEKDNIGQCQPDGTYKWGFSFIQGFIALLLLSSWTVAVFVVWLRAHLKLLRYEGHEKPNRYQAALLLSKSIEYDFKGFEDPSTTTNRSFDRHVAKTLNGGMVELEPLSPTAELHPGFKRSLKNWFQKERWWASFLMLDTVWLGVGWLTIRSWLSATFYWLTLFAWPSIVFALILGTTRNSRLFFVTSWVTFGIAMLLPLFWFLFGVYEY